jgi:hypothetical protein
MLQARIVKNAGISDLANLVCIWKTIFQLKDRPPYLPSQLVRNPLVPIGQSPHTDRKAHTNQHCRPGTVPPRVPGCHPDPKE